MQQNEPRTITVGPTKTATVEIRNLSKYEFRARTRMEWGFGLPSILVIEIFPAEFIKQGTLYLPHDTAGRFPTN